MRARMGREQDQLEAVFDLVDAVFDGDARHAARLLPGIQGICRLLKHFGQLCKPAKLPRTANGAKPPAFAHGYSLITTPSADGAILASISAAVSRVTG